MNQFLSAEREGGFQRAVRTGSFFSPAQFGWPLKPEPDYQSPGKPAIFSR